MNPNPSRTDVQPLDPEAVRRHFSSSRRAVLAMHSGGCARYLLSSRIAYGLDADGSPLFAYEPSTPHVDRFITHTTMTLAVEYPADRTDGIASEIVLTGQVEEVNPEDRAAHARYRADFPDVQLGTDEGLHLYRFRTRRADLVRPSGEKIALPELRRAH